MNTRRTFNLIFYPKKSKGKKGNTLIYVRITINTKRTDISLNRHVDLNEWNVQSKRLNGRTPEAKSFNSYLDSVEFRIFEIYKELVEEGIEITGDMIKARLMGIDTDKPRMLMEIFEHHNKQFAELVGKDFAIGTYKRFKVCAKSLREFLQWKFEVSDVSIKKLNFEFISVLGQILLHVWRWK